MEVNNRKSCAADVRMQDAMQTAAKALENAAFIFENTSGMESLPANLVERGEVFKTLVVEAKDYTVSLLTLLPNSAIKEHEHVDDQEWYFIVSEKTIKVCSKGDSHSLENNTDDIMFVLSIKYN